MRYIEPVVKTRIAYMLGDAPTLRWPCPKQNKTTAQAEVTARCCERILSGWMRREGDGECLWVAPRCAGRRGTEAKSYEVRMRSETKGELCISCWNSVVYMDISKLKQKNQGE